MKVERRECGCPPWTIRCAHWEGRILAMGIAQLHGVGDVHEPNPRGSFVVFITDGWGPSTVCGDPTHEVTVNPEHLLYASEITVATAEFLRREADLLGREVRA